MIRERNVGITVFLPRKIVEKLEKNREERGIPVSTQVRACVMEKLNG